MSTPSNTASSASQKAIISKVLVAIDGSDESINAADHAIFMSKKYNAELYALHVIHTDVELFGPHETSDFTIKRRDECEKYLNKVKLKANEKSFK